MDPEDEDKEDFISFCKIKSEYWPTCSKRTLIHSWTQTNVYKWMKFNFIKIILILNNANNRLLFDPFLFGKLWNILGKYIFAYFFKVLQMVNTNSLDIKLMTDMKIKKKKNFSCKIKGTAYLENIKNKTIHFTLNAI